jgi:hypothetical protein
MAKKMNAEHTELESHLNKTTITSNIVSVVIALVTALSIGYGFYYNTKDTLNDHTLQINEVKVEVKEIKEAVNNSAVFQGASTEQIKSLENQMNDVKSSQLRIEEKIDKLILRSK